MIWVQVVQHSGKNNEAGVLVSINNGNNIYAGLSNIYMFLAEVDGYQRIWVGMNKRARIYGLHSYYWFH